MPLLRSKKGRVGPQRALFTCFTSTRVPILTQMTVLRSEKQEEWDRRELAQLKEELQVLRYAAAAPREAGGVGDRRELVQLCDVVY